MQYIVQDVHRILADAPRRVHRRRKRCAVDMKRRRSHLDATGSGGVLNDRKRLPELLMRVIDDVFGLQHGHGRKTFCREQRHDLVHRIKLIKPGVNNLQHLRPVLPSGRAG